MMKILVFCTLLLMGLNAEVKKEFLNAHSALVTAGEKYDSYKNYYVTKGGHSFCSDISPNRSYVVSDDNNDINIWDTRTGQIVRKIQGHTDYIRSLLITKDSKYVISASEDKSIKVWNLKNGKLEKVLYSNDSAIYNMAMSTNKNWLVFSDGKGVIRVLDMHTEEIIQSFTEESKDIRALDIDNEGKYVLSGGYSKTSMNLWDISTGKKSRKFTGHSEGIESVAISDNKKYAVSGSYDESIKIWDLHRGKLIRTLSVDNESIASLDISSDSKYLLSTSKEIKLWDLKSGKLLNTFYDESIQRDADPTNNVVGNAKFTEDDSEILSHGYDYNIRIWDISKHKIVDKFYSFRNMVSVVRFSPDNKYIIVGLKNKAQIDIWDIEKNALHLSFNDRSRHMVSALAISENSKYLFIAMGWGTGGGSNIHIQMWDMKTKKHLHTFVNKSDNAVERSNLFSLALSPDNKYLASYLEDNLIEIWDIEKRKLLYLINNPSGDLLSSLVFTVDSKYLLFKGKVGEVVMWDIANNKLFRSIKISDKKIDTLALTKDGKKLLVASADKIYVGSFNKKTIINTFSVKEAPIHELIVRNNGEIFVSESSSSVVNIWSKEKKKALYTFDIDKKYAMYTSVVDISNDAKTMLIGFEDGTIKLFNVNNMGKAIKTFISGDKGNWVVFDEEKKKFFRADEGSFLFKKNVVYEEPFLKVNNFKHVEVDESESWGSMWKKLKF